MNAKAPGSDPIYKRLLAFPEVVADLLRSLLHQEDIGIDESSLRKLPAEYVADDYRQRRGDTVWRVRARAAESRGGWLHVLVLLEFQSTDDRKMALRVLEYTVMLYRELVRQDLLGPDGLLPPVLPVVLYNGDAPWRSASQVGDLIAATRPALAPFQPSQRHIVLDERRMPADDPWLGDLTRAMVLVEQSQSIANLVDAAALLKSLLYASRDELKQAFADWLDILLRRLEGTAEPESAERKRSLEEVTMTLEERVAEWPKPYIRQGWEQGREEGIGLGREEGIGLGRAEGIGLGREQGISEGIAQQRTLLRRQATARFGEETAERLANALAAEDDPERLAEVAEAIVRCTTGHELLREAGVPGVA